MKITILMTYNNATETLNPIYPDQIIRIPEIIDTSLPELISKREHIKAGTTYTYNDKDQWVYIQYNTAQGFTFFAADIQIDPATLLQCFALIRASLRAETIDVPNLIKNLEEILADRAGLNRHFSEKAKQTQKILDETTELLATNLNLLLERGEKIEALVAKTEKLCERRPTFKTNAFRLYQPKRDQSWSLQFLICGSDPNEPPSPH